MSNEMFFPPDAFRNSFSNWDKKMHQHIQTMVFSNCGDQGASFAQNLTDNLCHLVTNHLEGVRPKPEDVVFLVYPTKDPEWIALYACAIIIREMDSTTQDCVLFKVSGSTKKKALEELHDQVGNAIDQVVNEALAQQGGSKW